MTIEKLKELMLINETKDGLWKVIEDCEKGYWVEVRTPNYNVCIKTDSLRKSFINFLMNMYEDCCKKIDNA